MHSLPADPERTRGRYSFTLDGRPAGIDERFVLGEIAPGVVRVRTTRVSSRPMSRWESDVRIERDQTTVAIRFTGSGEGVVRAASAQLVEAGGTVTASRVVDGTTWTAGEALGGRIDALAHAVAGPLMLDAVPNLAVVAPDAFDPTHPTRFLSPLLQTWRCSELESASVEVSGVAHEGTAYDWADETTHRTGVVVVDGGGMLLSTAVATPEGLLEVRLVEVSGAWPVPLAWSR
jgi:hypothetical protein